MKLRNEHAHINKTNRSRAGISPSSLRILAQSPVGDFAKSSSLLREVEQDQRNPFEDKPMKNQQR